MFRACPVPCSGSAILDKPGVTGGATVHLQRRDHSIAAIAARDNLLIVRANAPNPEPVVPVADDQEVDIPAEAGISLSDAELRRAVAA